MTQFWQRGELTKLAAVVGIRLNHLSEILHRKRGVSVTRALALERASRKVFGYPIPWNEWLLNKESDHPAFHGKPIR